MTVAVVVIAAGRLDHLERALHGLARQTCRPDDVVVVDMAPDGSMTALVDRAQIGRVILGPAASRDGRQRLPLGAARNAGATAADSDQLVFLDVDCIPATDLVARYVDVLDRHPSALACGPIRYLPQEWLRHSPVDPVRAGLGDGAGATIDAQLERVAARHPARPEPKLGDVSLADDHELFWSLSFGVTRATWSRLGGFDEGYCGYGGEDTDLGLQARRLGIRLAWFAGGVAYHQWHPPTRFDRSHVRDIVANAHRFRARWGHWPMTGWLQELDERRWVRFDPASDRLDLVEDGSR